MAENLLDKICDKLPAIFCAAVEDYRSPYRINGVTPSDVLTETKTSPSGQSYQVLKPVGGYEEIKSASEASLSTVAPITVVKP
jgi:hypothetical protein